MRMQEQINVIVTVYENLSVEVRDTTCLFYLNEKQSIGKPRI